MRKMAIDIVKQILEIGGKDAAKAFRIGLESGGANAARKSEVSMLLSALDSVGVKGDKTIAEIFGAEISAQGNIAVKKSKGFKKQAVKANNEAYRVRPPREKAPEEVKIEKIKELMANEKAAYETKNAEFIATQRTQIDEFNKHLDECAEAYAKVVAEAEKCTASDSRKFIANEFEYLDKKMEEAIEVELIEMGTLSDKEIKSVMTQAKAYVQARVQNKTYAQAVTSGLKAEADKIIADVSREFHLVRSVTPAELKILVESRLQKIEALAVKAKLEEKGTLKRAVKVGGMDSAIPIEIPLFGTSATEQIAKISGGKTPKEAVQYYRNLYMKINKACKDISATQAKEKAGYVQLVERTVDIPIKEIPKSKKLLWYEAQLQEKQTALQKRKEAEKGARII